MLTPADGGPRSQVCARLTLRSAPHRQQQKMSAHMSGRRGGQTNSKNVLINCFAISGDSKHFSFFSKKPKKSHFLCHFKPDTKFQNPMITLSGIWGESKCKREKNELIVDT